MKYSRETEEKCSLRLGWQFPMTCVRIHFESAMATGSPWFALNLNFFPTKFKSCPTVHTETEVTTFVANMLSRVKWFN